MRIGNQKRSTIKNIKAMKKYIQPTIEIQQVQVEQLIATSDPKLHGKTTTGEQLAPGRRSSWDADWE